MLQELEDGEDTEAGIGLEDVESQAEAAVQALEEAVSAAEAASLSETATDAQPDSPQQEADPLPASSQPNRTPMLVVDLLDSSDPASHEKAGLSDSCTLLFSLLPAAQQKLAFLINLCPGGHGQGQAQAAQTTPHDEKLARGGAH